ncbi:MAG: hypothetical protein ACRD9R_24155 [Pyrinomonadaceae bacterium]
MLGLILLAAAAVGGAPAGVCHTLPADSAAALPSGGKIAFLGAAAGVIDIYLIGLDGSGLENITRGRLSGISAFSWSPDGSQLVVSADRGRNLYVVAADASSLRALTHNVGFAITQTPTWSPDGSRIAYIGNAAQNYDVFLINPDGSGTRRLTQTNGIYRDLAWSPDGSRIAYASGADFFHVHIHTMRADGGLPTQVSAGAGSDSAPSWSPDGRAIAYQSDFQFGPPEIFTVNADGANQTRLTNVFASDSHPSWSPDGEKIAFASNRDSVGGGSYALYVMNRDGSNPERVPGISFSALNPAWRPRPSAPPPGIPLLLTEGETAGRALALDSVTLVRAPLPVFTSHNFSPDQHTRALLFLANIAPAAFAHGLAVTVQITDAQHRLFELTPERVDAVPHLEGIAQLTVRLPDELAGGEMRVSVTVGGAPSNSATLEIKPSTQPPL